MSRRISRVLSAILAMAGAAVPMVALVLGLPSLPQDPPPQDPVDLFLAQLGLPPYAEVCEEFGCPGGEQSCMDFTVDTGRRGEGAIVAVTYICMEP